jgi:hypothetical protein
LGDAKLSIETVFAHVSCSDIETSLARYGYFIMRIRDPDDNLIVFASARRD